ncbi:MAG: hypothetical protein KJ930_14420 [Gammaproteobacteria bacterium]|jgi:hypothetical protein|nr:hypothetical protein [Gammaproteobacteria bacterium]MBU2225690.1 hypothetical protein [Gammaproteobacteria bacterium]
MKKDVNKDRTLPARRWKKQLNHEVFAHFYMGALSLALLESAGEQMMTKRNIICTIKTPAKL